MRKMLFVFYLLAALALAPFTAWAQGACPISNQVVQNKTGTTYTVATTDICSTLNFTNTAAVAVALPNAATTFPQGFEFWVKASGGAVTITPTTSTINGGSTVVIAGGTSALIVSDNTNYQALSGGGGTGGCTSSGASPQTCNGAAGVATTGTLTTAASTAAAAYTVTNSAVTASSVVICTVDAYSGTIHTNGVPVVTQCVPGSGSFVATIQNVDTTNALNGTVGIGFRVSN